MAEKRISKLIIETFFGTVSSKKLTLLGFAFKSNTNDTRESPAITIAKELLENGADLCIHDPQVSESQISKILDIDNSNKTKKSIEGSWSYSNNLELAFTDADAIIILTEWEEYFKINWQMMSLLMRRPSWIFDTRGIIEYKNLKGTNLNFWKIGKGFVSL